MVTVEQILAAEGDVLSRLLARTLGLNDACQCHTKYGTTYNASRDMRSLFCVGCGGEVIPLNWDNAMKWRDWAVKECNTVEVYKGLIQVATQQVGDKDQWIKDDFIIHRAQPKHYLQAAAICKIGAKP